MGVSKSKTVWKEDDVHLAKKNLDNGSFHFHNQQYVDALHHYETALSIKQKYLKDDDALLAKTFLHVGKVYKCLKSYKQAIKFHEKALTTYQKGLEKDPTFSSKAIKVCKKLACLYELQKKYTEAIFYLRKALDIILKYFKRQHPLYAAIHYNLGLLYKRMRLYDHATQHFQTYIHVIKDQENKVDDRTLIKCYQYLGQISKVQNQMGKALDYYENCLDYSIKLYGVNHLQTSVAYNNLSLAQKDNQEFELAFNNMLNCLQIELRLLDRKNPKIEVTIQGLSMLCKYYNQGAQRFYKTLSSYKTSKFSSASLDSTNETNICLSDEETLEKESCILTSAELNDLLENKKDCSDDILSCTLLKTCKSNFF